MQSASAPTGVASQLASFPCTADSWSDRNRSRKRRSNSGSLANQSFGPASFQNRTTDPASAGGEAILRSPSASGPRVSLLDELAYSVLVAHAIALAMIING